MYRITCCRYGKSYNNHMAKGSFIKEFNTLSEFVKYYMSTNFKIFYPNIKNELNSKEYHIVRNKLYAMSYKKKY